MGLERVDDLNWDVDNAVKVKKVKETKAERRARRKAEMARMLAKLNAEEQAE